MTDLPSRAQAAAEFRKMLDESSLGAPDVKAAIARNRRYTQAPPEAWAQLSKPDLIKLLDDYRDRRETWQEDHAAALTHVLAEIDFEPAQSDLSEE